MCLHSILTLSLSLSLTHGCIFRIQVDMLPAPSPYRHVFPLKIIHLCSVVPSSVRETIIYMNIKFRGGSSRYGPPIVPQEDKWIRLNLNFLAYFCQTVWLPTIWLQFFPFLFFFFLIGLDDYSSTSPLKESNEIPQNKDMGVILPSNRWKSNIILVKWESKMEGDQRYSRF